LKYNEIPSPLREIRSLQEERCRNNVNREGGKRQGHCINTNPSCFKKKIFVGKRFFRFQGKTNLGRAGDREKDLQLEKITVTKSGTRFPERRKKKTHLEGKEGMGKRGSKPIGLAIW